MYTKHPPAWAAPKRDRYRFFKMFAILLAVCAFAYLTIESVLPHLNGLQAPLRFTDDGSFQITIFEDTHFGESTQHLLAFLTMLY